MLQISPTYVAFTGPATDRAGQPVLRENLKKLAEAKGFRVQSSVNRQTCMVVASRSDTVKARKATAAGLDVLDYPSFIEALGGELPTGGQHDRWVDAPRQTSFDFGDEPGVEYL